VNDTEAPHEYAELDPVLKKDISFGIYEGFVLRAFKSYQTGEAYVRVKWSHGQRSTLKASAVLPNTPENLKKLEERHERRVAKQEQRIAK
jgi:hypothetical protein